MTGNVKQQLIIIKNELSDLIAMLYAMSLNERGTSSSGAPRIFPSDETAKKIFLYIHLSKTIDTNFKELFIRNSGDMPEYSRLYNERLEIAKKRLISKLTDVTYKGISQKLPPEKLFEQFSKEFDTATKGLQSAAETYAAKQENYEAFEELVQKGVTMFAVTSGTCGACAGGGPYTAREMKGLDFPPFHINCGCTVKEWIEPVIEEQISSASDDLIKLLTDYEKYYEMPYRGQDSQNRTVGYGHVITQDDGTKYDSGITENDARSLLESDLDRVVYQYLNPWISKNSISLTQQQYDALVSFTFNVGQRWIKESTLKTVLENGDFDKVGDAMMMWVIVNGQRSLGLYRRRTDEVNMFYDGVYARTYPNWGD